MKINIAETFAREGETVEEAKARIKKEQEERDAQTKDRNKALSQEDSNMTDCVVNKEDAFENVLENFSYRREQPVKYNYVNM